MRKRVAVPLRRMTGNSFRAVPIKAKALMLSRSLGCCFVSVAARTPLDGGYAGTHPPIGARFFDSHAFQLGSKFLTNYKLTTPHRHVCKVLYSFFRRTSPCNFELQGRAVFPNEKADGQS